ncbi:alpha/beta hydrolase family protein [Tsuneonella mangrovi]|uniref:alpha/beta hydrolase family protein n=1 Tax=Tsuneonella mangrovi TaxID=1982042 RepID=UPI0012379206|nr:alpha/beta fold hydrolase [Tsuneonella mangrovi]
MTTPVQSSDYYAGENLWGTDAHMAAGKPDAVLRYGSGKRAFGELRLPVGSGPFPLAVIYHGGCWKAGIATQAYMTPLAAWMQQHGIASLNVDYREVGDGGGWPGSFEDWRASASLIDEIAVKYPVDRNRVTLVGHSAGALPALWLGEPQGADGPVGPQEPVAARAAIVFDGPGDVGAEREAFDKLCDFPSVDPFMGGTNEQVPARYTAISPATHAPALAQVMFVQAVLPSPSDTTLKAIGVAGAGVSVVENPGASHFAIVTPGDETFAKNEAALLKVLHGE